MRLKVPKVERRFLFQDRQLRVRGKLSALADTPKNARRLFKFKTHKSKIKSRKQIQKLKNKDPEWT